ncbi:uncharacterized protein [Hyperolius riggenbachi]|uniref:uncharacterized protein isoform X1 n=1 Tax=Hyperolius riggenbachi TaxID=752182 RepID=UPI0035A39D48
MMENRPPFPPPDEYNNRNPPERWTSPHYSQDVTQDHYIPQDENPIGIKVEVKEEVEEIFVMGDVLCEEVEITPEISTDLVDTRGRDVKAETMEAISVTIKEEEVPMEISTDAGDTRVAQTDIKSEDEELHIEIKEEEIPEDISTGGCTFRLSSKDRLGKRKARRTSPEWSTVKIEENDSGEMFTSIAENMEESDSETSQEELLHDRQRAYRFTKEENNALCHLACQHYKYLMKRDNNVLQLENKELMWKEIAKQVSEVERKHRRTSRACRRRFQDCRLHVRRMMEREMNNEVVRYNFWQQKVRLAMKANPGLARRKAYCTLRLSSKDRLGKRKARITQTETKRTKTSTEYSTMNTEENDSGEMVASIAETMCMGDSETERQEALLHDRQRAYRFTEEENNALCHLVSQHYKFLMKRDKNILQLEKKESIWKEIAEEVTKVERKQRRTSLACRRRFQDCRLHVRRMMEREMNREVVRYNIWEYKVKLAIKANPGLGIRRANKTKKMKNTPQERTMITTAEASIQEKRTKECPTIATAEASVQVKRTKECSKIATAEASSQEKRTQECAKIASTEASSQEKRTQEGTKIDTAEASIQEKRTKECSKIDTAETSIEEKRIQEGPMIATAETSIEEKITQEGTMIATAEANIQEERTQECTTIAAAEASIQEIRTLVRHETVSDDFSKNCITQFSKNSEIVVIIEDENDVLSTETYLLENSNKTTTTTDNESQSNNTPHLSSTNVTEVLCKKKRKKTRNVGMELKKSFLKISQQQTVMIGLIHETQKDVLKNQALLTKLMEKNIHVNEQVLKINEQINDNILSLGKDIRSLLQVNHSAET